MKTIYRPGIVFLFSLFLFLAAKASPKSDMEVLRKRFIDELLLPAVDESRVQNLLTTFRADSVWPGIDYVDVSRTGFQHSVHLNNMVYLGRAYKQKHSPFKGNRKVKNTLSVALDFWLRHDFICENWWWNQIGTPSSIISLLLIMDKDLSPAQVEKMLEIAGRANLNASGARPSGDRIKIAGLQAKTALFLRDVETLEMTLEVIEGEIKFATGRGMQYDYSFHHRVDNVNNTLSYGLGYADAFAEWAAKVEGTSYCFSEKALHRLIDYYLDGICKQMVYGRNTDPGVMNRDITRPERGSFSAVTPQRLASVSDYRKEELQNIIAVRKGEDVIVPSFAKFFWNSEHFVYQRPGLYTSVRMHSTRNDNMEVPYNGEGLMNHYRGDGTNYISVRGDEYRNLAPVYDYMRIPGATTVITSAMPSEDDVQKRGLSSFVGAVTDGLYGAVAYDFKSPHHPLAARKSWFFFDEEYVCLGAGIGSETRYPVVTTVNQCLLRGEVTVKDKTGVRTMPQGNRVLDGAQWVYHDGLSYIFPSPVSVSLSDEPAEGSWFRVNRQSDSSKEIVSKDIFKLWLEHGKQPQEATYQYIVKPVKSPDDIPSRLPVEVLSNTKDLQAVKHPGLGIVYAVFYRCGKLAVVEGLEIESDSPGIVMLRYSGKEVKSISASDPSRTMGKLHLNVNGRNVAIDLPQSVYAGKTATVSMK